MKLSAILAGAAALSCFAWTTSGYTNPITIKGYKMFDLKTGAYFAAKGIDYYPRPNTGILDANNIDLFTDDYSGVWANDIAYLAATGANAVRLYAVDPTKSHDNFMCALRSYGMYALVDLGASCTNCSISSDPYPACYSSNLKDRGEQIVTAFAKYDNVLAFSAGNEVNHVVTDATTNAPCQKKFIKDMRKFISGCSSTMRAIPVGVVSADTDREKNAKYYNCRTDSTDTLENAEWFGLNAYQYCDGTVTDVSQATGFTNLVSDFTSYKTSIPVMLTEFGCLNPSFPTVSGYDAQRTWLQAGWLHTPTFRKIFSGGFVFEFSTENANSKGDGTATATNGNSLYPFTKYGAQNYGLGYYSPENCDHSTTKCTFNPMPNYYNLSKQYNATSYAGEAVMSVFTPDSDRSSPPACPTGFPKLADATWATDKVASRACPSTVLSFTCPSQTSSGTWTGSSLATTTTTTTTTPGTTTATPGTSTNTGTSSASPPLPSGLATSVISACMALAIGVAFA
ncbi:hypothetical protein Gpo141_00006367 [Globisporangium polare]